MLQPHAFDTRCAALAERLSTLPDKPEETPASTLKVLWLLAVGHAVSVEAAESVDSAALPALDADQAERLEGLIERRLQGIPLAHLSERQHFMGLEMLAGPGALIPRRETELLGRTALELLQALPGEPVVVDVCTGSGNLALALAHHAPPARVHAADLSDDAVALARRNAEHLGLAARVDLRCGDLLEPFNEPRFQGQVNLLVCNPPYISSQKVDTLADEIRGHEPRLAFDGGPLGVRILQRLIREAPQYLAPGGWLAFEVGLGQGPAVLKRLQASGAFTHTRGVNDGQGEMRVLVASR